MAKIISETRSFRNALKTFLESASWSDLTFSEGWSELDVTNPLVNIYIGEEGKTELEMGRTTTHKLFMRFAQVDVYMESEDRVRTICEDISDFMDTSSIEIRDITSASGYLIGYMTCYNTEGIQSDLIPPIINDPEIIRWRGIVRAPYEAYYPNGGSPV